MENRACEYAVPWVNHVAPLAGCRVVEIGCGTGSSTCAFAQLTGQIQGYDISPSYVAGALNRAHALGLTNVDGQAIAPEQLLSEVGHRHQTEKADLVLLYAVLEHCTSEECLETLRTSWDVLRPGGHLVVIETPNRFGYMDIHTAFLPFFHMLPGPIALRYYRRSQRQKIIRTLDQALFKSDGKPRQHLWFKAVGSKHRAEILNIESNLKIMETDPRAEPDSSQFCFLFGDLERLVKSPDHLLTLGPTIIA